MNFLARHGLFLQYFGLLCATTMVAGGGQFPGNAAGLFVIIKFFLLLAPIIVITFLSCTHPVYRQNLFDILRHNILLIVFFGSIIMSLPLADYPVFSTGRYLYTLFGFISLLSIAAQYRRIACLKLHTSLMAVFLLSWVASIYIVSSYTALRDAIQADGHVHPNMLSSLCAQCLLGILFQRMPKPYGVLFKGCLIAGLIITIIMLQSRGVWVALLCAGLAYLSHNALYNRSWQPLLALCAVGLSAVTLVLASIINPAFGSYIVDFIARGQPLTDLLTFTNRLQLWNTLFEAITLKQVLVGYGYAVMAPAISVDFGDGILYGAHSGYLSLFFGTGFICTMLFILYWSIKFITLNIQYKKIDLDRFYLCLTSFIVFFVHSITAEEFGLHVTPTFVLLFLNFQKVERLHTS